MEANPPTTPTERKGLALSAFIIAGVALICSFITGWRIFSLILSLGAFVLSAFCLGRASKARVPRTMPLAALIISLAAAIVSGYFIYNRTLEKTITNNAETIPRELKDTTRANNEEQDAIDKLKNITDSSTGQ